MKITAAILVLAAGTAFAGEYDDIQVIRADERGFAFEYKPANVRVEAAGASGAMNSGQNDTVGARVDLSQRLAISNCARTTAVGNYDLPVRVVLIGIPADARPEVSATIMGEAGFAASSASMTGRSSVVENFSTGAENFALVEEKRGMENRVVADAPTWIGNQRVLRVKIFPAAYDERTNQYRVAEKLQIELRFNSSGPFALTSATTRWEKVLRHGILNYEQAKMFRGSPAMSGALAKTAAFSSPFGQSTNWVKVTFQDNGIYRIDRAALAAIGVPVSTLDPRTFRIFSQGGRVLPAFNNVPRPDWKEHALEVTGEGDGTFDPSDEIHFYGWSAEGWDRDSTFNSFKFVKNNYISTQIFWLSWGGNFSGPAHRMMGTMTPIGPTDTVTSFPARLRFEQDRILAVANGSDINDYYNWYGGRGTPQTYFFNLPNLVANIDTVKVGHLSAGVSLSVNSSFATQIGATSGLTTFQTGALKAGLNRVDLGVAAQIFTGYNHFDYLEIFYNRAPIYIAPLMELETPPVSGLVEFQIGGSPVNFVIWSIYDRYAPSFMQATRNASGVLSFVDDANVKRIYVLTSTADLKRPTLSRLNPVDLTTGPNQGEFIIIAPQAFQSALSSYAAHRSSFSGLNVKAVAVEEIYNNFSGGLPDPVAIRDFLKFVRQNWADPKPRYVLLVGDGTYDFRNIEGTSAVNYIPPFIVDQAFDASSLSDEGYLYFGNPGIIDSADQTLDIAVARWPVKNVSELQVVADKIRRYETSPEYGVWRNRLTLAADDEFGAFLNEGFHTDQAEDMSRNHLPRRFDQKKVYLFDFPFDGLRQKPVANQAIVRAWNEGHALIDYIGHGNPNVWAHERVFKREEDLPLLANGGRLPLVYAASCDINVFYEPLADGMGEDLIKNPNGGAVAVIAAVRIVFSGPNTDLNNKVFDLLFASDSLSVGEAFYLGKLLRQPNTNDRRYLLFGDPAMHLARPQYNIRLTVPDSLSALTVAFVSGEVTDTLGNRLTGFNGTVQLFVFDGLRFKAHRMEAQPDNLIPYLLPGNMIYRGEAQVTAGQFSISFVVPKDISYGSKTGKISAYAWNTSGDAVGFEDSVSLSGSAAATTDTAGPKITVATAANATVQAGDEISSGVGLKIVLEDSSGINITGEPAHALTAQFDFPDGPSFDLTEAFRYQPQSFSKGEAAFSVPALEPGGHSLRIKAWDAANNSSVLEMPLEVLAAGDIQLSGVLNYPNPMKDKTNFCYTLSTPADEIVIEIFSLAGRLVRTIRSSATQAGYNFQTEWNGQDNDGDRVASGVYLYKIRARQAAKETEEFGKLVVMR